MNNLRVLPNNTDSDKDHIKQTLETNNTTVTLYYVGNCKLLLFSQGAFRYSNYQIDDNHLRIISLSPDLLFSRTE